MPISALDFLPIPAGSLELRDARRQTTRLVELAEFSIAATPVTCAQYTAVTGAPLPPGASQTSPAHSISWFDAAHWCNAASAQRGLPPAYEFDGDSVGWRVESAGYRLPTEAEWEWACRATTTGPTYGDLKDIAWAAADEVDGPQPVGTKKPNPFGLYDMLGNIWEWCWDYADTARYADYRVLRGGGWADKPWSIRASVRRASTPGTRLDDVGFRPARGVVGEPGSQSAQGWSARADRERADRPGPRPAGWTPLE